MYFNGLFLGLIIQASALEELSFNCRYVMAKVGVMLLVKYNKKGA